MTDSQKKTGTAASPSGGRTGARGQRGSATQQGSPGGYGRGDGDRRHDPDSLSQYDLDRYAEALQQALNGSIDAPADQPQIWDGELGPNLSFTSLLEELAKWIPPAPPTGFPDTYDYNPAQKGM